MNKKVLAIVGGGCLVLLLCAICGVVGYTAFQSQASDILAQVQGLQTSKGNNDLPAPTSASKSSAPEPTKATTQPSNPSSPSTNPADAITKAFGGWKSVKSFRAHMTTSAGGAGSQEIDMEFVSPDRYHMNMKGAEIIMIGTTSYFKVGNAWQKMTLPQSVDLSMADAGKFQTALGATPDVKLVGADVVDGTPTTVYQVNASASGSQSTKIWLGVADGLPRKIVNGASTITFSDFNGNITINPPIP